MKRLALSLAALLMMSSTVLAADYSYISTLDMKEALEAGKKMTIVDIQLPTEYAKYHFKGALETDAFPAATASEKARLDIVLPVLAASNDEVIIVCPRGGGGARNTYDYLKSKGVSEKRMRILEGGMQGWPYKSMAEKGAAKK